MKSDYSVDETAVYDAIKILSVVFDNAIQESETLNDNYIYINCYREDYIMFIDVQNKIGENVDLKKIDEDFYTTKGEGHGLGLLILRNVVSINKKVKACKTFNRELFKQSLKIQLQKEKSH